MTARLARPVISQICWRSNEARSDVSNNSETFNAQMGNPLAYNPTSDIELIGNVGHTAASHFFLNVALILRMHKLLPKCCSLDKLTLNILCHFISVKDFLHIVFGSNGDFRYATICLVAKALNSFQRKWIRGTQRSWICDNNYLSRYEPKVLRSKWQNTWGAAIWDGNTLSSPIQKGSYAEGQWAQLGSCLICLHVCTHT